MAGHRLIVAPGLDAATVEVVDAYLAGVGRLLPGPRRLSAAVLAEMREDLLDATSDRATVAATPVQAAYEAVRDFGDAPAIAAALRPELAARQARRCGLALLATGPVVGACWLAAALAAHHGASLRWLLLLVAPVIAVGAGATGLTVATTGPLTRWLRPDTPVCRRAVTVAGVAAGIGDVALLAGCLALLLGSRQATPLLLPAVGASVVRLVLLARAARTHRWLPRRYRLGLP